MVITSLLGIAAALLLGMMSPGPSFLLVARTAVVSRRDGMAAAAGMAAGSTVIATLALLGLQRTMRSAPELFLVLKIMGAAYLLLIAYRLWKAKAPTSDAQPAAGAGGGLQKLLLALGTQLSNPKTLLVYGSVFAAGLPTSVPSWFWTALLAYVVVAEFSWYAIVAAIFSAPPARAAYMRASRTLDRVAGAFMAGLAITVAFQQT